MRIGQLVKRSGKTARTLHFYEELGLLRPSARTNGGFRLYADDALVRIQWIERLQEIGFSLSEIQDFLARMHEESTGPEAMTRLAAFYREKLEETQLRLGRLKALEQDLTNSIAYLEGCRPCDPLTPRTACATCTEHTDTAQPTMVAAVHRN